MKEGIKKNLITIATVGTAIALIGIFCTVLTPLRLLFPTLIACLIAAAALIADLFFTS